MLRSTNTFNLYFNNKQNISVMNWKSIKEVPKIKKGRAILFAQLNHNGKLTILSHLSADYNEAVFFRNYELKNTWSHWCYIMPPNNSIKSK